MPLPPAPRPKAPRPASRIAVVGAGIAGIACARTLVQAGRDVTVFEADAAVGGRMATETSPYGSFDSGAQYFTVRDRRFALALEATGAGCRPWSATTVRVLDPQGRVAAAGLPPREPHWVAVPGMAALPQLWAAPLAAAGRLHTGTAVTALERDTLDRRRWQLRTGGATPVHAGFDTVLLALPAPQAAALLQAADADTGAAALAQQVEPATMAPCWTLMLAFPQASQPGVVTLGPQWNAARSTHHRIAWLARESSKPGRERIERWTVQASEVWSEEHRHDTPNRVRDKMLRAFAEVTGIRATAGHAAVRLWLHAKTTQPAGRSHLWDASAGLGACGDWCIGHRVEDAFVSGLELALAAV